MKKRVTTFLRVDMAAVLLALSCAGCASSSDTIPTQEQTQEVTEQETKQETKPKDFKVEITEEENQSWIRYQDDYYEYVNQDLLDLIHLSGSDAQWTWFGEISAVTSQETRSMIQTLSESDEVYPKGSSEQKIKDLYGCISDMESRNATGLTPLQPYLDSVQEADTIEEYVDALAELSAEYGFSSVVGGYTIEQDSVDSTQYSVYLLYADTLIGKEYLENAQMQEYVTTYFDYVEDVLEEYGFEKEQAVKAADEIEALARDICEATLSAEQYYDPSITYNPYTLEELEALYSNVNIPKLLKDLNIAGQDYYIVRDVGQAQKVNALLTQENLEALKLYTTFVAIKDVSEYTTQAYEKLAIDLDNKFYGVTESREDIYNWMSLTEEMLAWDFGKMYVEKYFSEESKQEVEALIADIIEAYKQIIHRQEWMSEETKEKACRKLDMMQVKIGYPDEWPKEIEKIEITPVSEGGSLLSNFLSHMHVAAQNQLEKLGQEYDKTVWSMPPQTVNAYYDPGNNEVVFPAAILQAPFYDSDNDDAQNLGGIGYVIAHEISHAFDSNGALYDEYGNYNMWWKQEELARYQQLSQSIVDYYNQQEMVGIHVNGELTLSENIADLGAMTCITSIMGEDTEALACAFSQFAYIWASESTISYQMYQLSSDSHAPGKIRVNAVLSSSDAFYQTYDIKEDDEMYVAPGNRVGIWK